MSLTASALLTASGLPARWRSCDRFVVLAIGSRSLGFFGALASTWRSDPQGAERLCCIVVDAPWPEGEGRREIEAAWDPAPEPSTLAMESTSMSTSTFTFTWPPPTRGFHRLASADARLQLLFAHGDAAAALRQCVARLDAIVFADGLAEAPLCVRAAGTAKALARLAAPQATLVGVLDDAAARARLRSAGFVEAAAAAALGQADDAACWQARFAPVHAPRRPAGRVAPGATADRHAVIVGGGLAGCATAWALAEQGWRSTLLERHHGLAREASGNVAGVFHGIVNGVDGLHARFNRAAALEAQRAVAVALRRHAVVGAVDGLLQLAGADLEVAAMRGLLARLGYAEAHIRALSAAEASARAGIELRRPAWWHLQGGWVDPAGLARAFVERAGGAVELQFGCEVAELRKDGDGWALLAQNGEALATARTVVLANAGAASRLADAAWPMEPLRGQMSVFAGAAAHGLHGPRLPITGSGYVLPVIDGNLVFGATRSRDDVDPAVRLADHRLNLAQLAALSSDLTGSRALDPATLSGRTAWRWSSRDRLPIIGAVPARLSVDEGRGMGAGRRDQPRFVAREPGLFVFTALGSRGITWSALGAQLLASIVSGAPSPLEAALLDAVDPARFGVRDGRRAGPPQRPPAQMP